MKTLREILIGLVAVILFLGPPVLTGCSSAKKPAPQADTDSDGTVDTQDSDDDNDGVADVSDTFPTNASESVDTDADGVGDNADLFPTNASETVDTDGDGVGDNSDNCVSVANAAQTNTDGAADGGDACDTDDDNDGVADASDAFPLNSAETTDTDGDGTGNVADTDDDGDGVADASDAFPLNSAETTDTDSDGTGNVADTDDDNDGTADGSDCLPLDSAGEINITNAAGATVCVVDDANDDNDAVADATDCLALDARGEINVTDSAGATACVVDDSDDDNDLVADASDAFPLDARETVDTDGDGTGNVADTDDDNDIILDGADNCPLVANGDQMNTDETMTGGDTLGDACDSDDDADTVADTGDNCPVDSNADQADLDVDTLGNVCDDDRNGNGVDDASVPDPDPDQMTYFASSTGTDMASGETIDDPMTLAGAYATAAAATPVRNVYLTTTTGGTPSYLLDAVLVLSEGVGLYGGFSSTAGVISRSIDPATTSIVGAVDASVLISGAGITSTTVVNTLSLTGGVSTTGSAIAVEIVNSSPTLTNLEIAGGDGDVNAIAIRITATGAGTAAPSITDNDSIAAGDATTDDSVGIDISASTGGTVDPTITGNLVIRAGTAGGESIGIRLFETDGATDPTTEARATIEDNRVEGSIDAETGTAVGIGLGADSGVAVTGFDSAVIRKNTILGGWGTTSAAGLSITGPEALTEVTNNIITAVVEPGMHAGAGAGSNVGVLLEGTDSFVALVNNTISTGNAPVCTMDPAVPDPSLADSIVALLIEDSSASTTSNPTVINNILFYDERACEGGMVEVPIERTGIAETCVGCDPDVLENQLFATTLTTYYVDFLDDGTSEPLPLDDPGPGNSVNELAGAADNIDGAPGFESVDQSTITYLRLGAGSPAIGAGEDVTNSALLDTNADGTAEITVTDDIDDDPRPTGVGFDIGADEDT